MSFVAEAAKDSAQTQKMWLLDPAASYVAYSSVTGELLGAYLLKPNYEGRGSHVANATYMVGRRQRGQGIGRLLGEHSIAQARQSGYRAMQFNAVVSANTAAVRLWEELGFARIGTVPQGFRLPDGSYSDLYIMYRTLEEVQA